VEPIADQIKRETIVAKLRQIGPELGFIKWRSRRGKRPEEVVPDQVRVVGIKHFGDWPEDREPEAREIRMKVRQALDDLFPKMEELALALKALCRSVT
jgi:hypothetical protein